MPEAMPIVGAGVTAFRPGDRVLALAEYGAFVAAIRARVGATEGSAS